MEKQVSGQRTIDMYGVNPYARTGYSQRIPGMPEPGTRISGSVSVTIGIPDAAAPEPVFLVSTATVKNVSFTLDEIREISAMGFCADTPADELIESIRYHHCHPMASEPGLSQLKDMRREEKERLEEPASLYPAQMVNIDANYKIEGTPILQWRKAYRLSESDTHEKADGWELTLSGSKIILGFAAWNNEEGIRSLITQMETPDVLMVMAGMTETEQTSLLTSTLAVRNLMESRTVKRVQNTPVKIAIQRYGLSSPSNMKEERKGRIRNLNLPTSAGSFSAAVGVIPPYYYTLTKLEFNRKQARIDAQRLPYTARQEAEKEAYRPCWLAWEEAFLSHLPEGWRRVDLPSRSYETGHAGQHVIWVTPLSEETWSDIHLAATTVAASYRMSAGRAF